MKNRSFLRTTVLVAFALALPAGGRLRADDKKGPDGEAKPSALARDMVGTWVLAGTPDMPEEPPRSGGRLKFFTGKHWCITEADPDTGKVIFHHGGTYTLDGDTMAETIEYANENTQQFIKQTNTFKVKVDGDTYTQVGQGNPFTEVWKRRK